MYKERMTALRKERGLSIGEVAKGVGVTPQTMGRYENGQRTPDVKIVYAIADFYDVSADYLLGRTDIRNVYKDSEKLVNDVAEIDGIIAKDMSRLMKAARNVIATAKSIDSDLQKYYWKKSEEDNDEAE